MNTLTPSRSLILVAVMLTASVGDTLLSHGMTQVGPVSIAQPLLLVRSLRNPWVIAGIVCLFGFFASYLSALSWADLTFVLPATASGYIVIALLSHFWLGRTHQFFALGGDPPDRLRRWFVANGPPLTEHGRWCRGQDLLLSGRVLFTMDCSPKQTSGGRL